MDERVDGRWHLAGAVLAVVGLLVLLARAVERGSLRHGVGLGVFGVCLVGMFAASALYHLSHGSARAALYRRLDHAMIYACIAGTFTPVCLIALRGHALGTWLLASMWTLAGAGIAVKALGWPLPRGLSTVAYLGLGWLGALTLPTLAHTAPTGLLGWLLAGGVLYSIGAVVYWRRWPRCKPGVFGFHELWHLFVLAASASHYWAVLRYVAPLG